jgi:preprotein translocase subunit SecA
MKEGESIEHPWVSRAIENAQRKVEGRNFDIRKQLLEYDDVANDQRKVVYEQRNELMETDDIADTISAIRHEVLQNLIGTYVPPHSLEEQWDIPGLEQALKEQLQLELPVAQWLEQDHDLHEETLVQRIREEFDHAYQAKFEGIEPAQVRYIEKAVMLQSLDSHWKEHLAQMDYLRQGIHLRGYAQKNPKQEYKREAFEMFSAMLEAIKLDVVTLLSKLSIGAPPTLTQPEPQAFEFKHEEFRGLEEAADGGSDPAAARAEPQGAGQQPFVRGDRKVGRNEPCPCGSGKKYKHCHGRLQ